MRRAPPVVVHLHPQRAVQALVAAIAALCCAALAGWATRHPGWAWAWPSWLLLAPVTAWAWQQAAVQPRRLRWDGQAWWLAAPAGGQETQVQLAVLIDLDAWLLLRATPGPCWLPLSRQQQMPHWGALRATLFAAPGGADTR